MSLSADAASATFNQACSKGDIDKVNTVPLFPSDRPLPEEAHMNRLCCGTGTTAPSRRAPLLSRFIYYSKRQPTLLCPVRPQPHPTPLPCRGQLLKRAYTDVNFRSDNGNRPIHYATRSGSAALVNVILDAGGDCNSSNLEGFVPLHGDSSSRRPLFLCMSRMPRHAAPRRDHANLALPLPRPLPTQLPARKATATSPTLCWTVGLKFWPKRIRVRRRCT